MVKALIYKTSYPHRECGKQVESVWIRFMSYHNKSNFVELCRGSVENVEKAKTMRNRTFCVNKSGKVSRIINVFHRFSTFLWKTLCKLL